MVIIWPPATLQLATGTATFLSNDTLEAGGQTILLRPILIAGGQPKKLLFSWRGAYRRFR